MFDKTIVIFDSVGAEPLKFTVIPKDISYLHRVYNGDGHDDPLPETIVCLIQDNCKFTNKFPIEEFVKGKTAVIVIGDANARKVDNR